MIRINQVKVPIEHKKDEIKQAAAKILKVSENAILNLNIVKRSIDARKKTEIKYSYTVDVEIKDEQKIVKKAKNPNVVLAKTIEYQCSITGTQTMKHRPVVVGSGPAGLFCAYFLALNGYQPILLERGEDVLKRVQTVEKFWNTNDLDTESNVSFGEGGAGTFSDGKLNTMVKDTFGRIRKVLELFVEHGANEEILYLNKPHIGTDCLRQIVKNIREDIIAHGGTVMFQSKLQDVFYEGNQLTGIMYETLDENHEKQEVKLSCEVLVLAIGHSARDTFEMLHRKNILMEQKAFAVGVRMEHKQEMINQNQYGAFYKQLPAADYKVTHQLANHRAVYSFCMCPGGYVVNASSERNRLTVNGMSYHDRGSDNANSAIIVTVSKEDFLSIPNAVDNPLSGMEYQRYYEQLAYETGKGNVPVQLFGDLLRDRESATIGNIQPNIKGNYRLSNLKSCLSKPVVSSLIEGIQAFDHMIPGFADEEAVLSGVEMRTSSPIRIIRNEQLESSCAGLYPCGEGAGYAGGITSAAVDGIKVFEAIAQKYKP